MARCPRTLAGRQRCRLRRLDTPDMLITHALSLRSKVWTKLKK